MSEPLREVSKLWGEDAARLGAMLKSDPGQSLAERWRHLTEKRPEIAAADFGFMPKLLEHQWAVMAVPDDGVIYTIGLSYHFDHPELLLHAPELLKDETLIPGMQAVLNQLARRVRAGEQVGAGQRVAVGGIELDFRPYRDEDFDLAPCGYLGGFTELFQDVVHEVGGTMPVVWCTTRSVAPPKKPAKKKAAPRKSKPTSKKKAAPRKSKPRSKKKARRAASASSRKR